MAVAAVTIVYEAIDEAMAANNAKRCVADDEYDDLDWIQLFEAEVIGQA